MSQHRDIPPAWQNKVWTSSTGAIKPNISNCMKVLREDPTFRDAIKLNEFNGEIETHRPLPWSEEIGRQWSDSDDIALAEWLQQNMIDVKVGTVHESIKGIAFENKYHPIRDYLNSLKWDGKPRLDNWLTYYCGAACTRFHQEAGRAWMIAGVARIMQPGCKADHVLILEGPQGIMKSTAFRILAGAAYFTDSLGDIGSKSADEALQGVWIVEFSELDGFSRAEATAIKAFISRQTDRFRVAYGRHVQRFPRSCIFCGTSNQSAYLKDESGNRRFWPVRCGDRIDIEALAEDKNQLWAEAVSRYRAGEAWWIEDPEVIEEARREQADRYQSDDWTEQVIEYMEKQTEDRTSLEIMVHCLGFKPKEIKTADSNRLSKLLTQAGYERTSKRRQHSTVKVWRRIRDVDEDLDDLSGPPPF